MSDPALELEIIESPCIQICTLNDDGLCIGCFRTSEEIGSWLTLSVDQRKQVLLDLPRRAEQLFGS